MVVSLVRNAPDSKVQGSDVHGGRLGSDLQSHVASGRLGRSNSESVTPSGRTYDPKESVVVGGRLGNLELESAS